MDKYFPVIQNVLIDDREIQKKQKYRLIKQQDPS